jgi:hypothetical protein
MRETCTSGSTRGRRVADYSVAYRPTLPLDAFAWTTSFLWPSWFRNQWLSVIASFLRSGLGR